ncbi:YuiA family protein [Aneurinibacillus tyrosinisolvens]|jgi:hypothetical protein|uniref:YuiA family protein n=1 Tax=Aneurinibacillus tyrosinisolvens TaxID=1443435 RepID=UPI00063FCE3F
MMNKTGEKKCEYCQGAGYFQLVTGGTETCPRCEGAGESKGSLPIVAVSKPSEGVKEFDHCSMF